MNISKVLIIDDEELIRATTMLLLRKHGFEVECVSNGNLGLEAAHRSQPDLILLDIMMPDMDGWEVLRSFKDDSVLSAIPVIIFTAIESELNDNDLHARGAFGMLRKPFHLKELLAIIGQVAAGGVDGKIA